MKPSSNWLVVYLFSVCLAAAVWVGIDSSRGRLTALAAVVLAIAIVRFPFALDAPPEGVRPDFRDLAGALAAVLPAIVFLAATWRDEFPTSGDQFVHNGFALEAYRFWWPWAWLAAVLAIAAVIFVTRRNPSSRVPLAAFALLMMFAAAGVRGGLSSYSPALVHFLAIPLRVIPAPTPIDVERLFNLLAIPAWLLVLRPRLIGRHFDASAAATAALFYWQKDSVYFLTSGYLEPWPIVLLLTAGEHLYRFRDRALWRPLLLLGAAAVMKEQMIVLLPIVALLFFPRREVWRHVATAAAAVTPFALSGAHSSAHLWSAAAFMRPAELFGMHGAQWRERIVVEFGPALPIVAIAVAALVILALRNRGAAALAIAAAIDFTVFFAMRLSYKWPGNPRTNLVPFAFAALALGFVIERLPARLPAMAAVALIAAVNAVPLAHTLRAAFEPSDARNFSEDHDAPIYYPVREALSTNFVPPGAAVDILNNGRRTGAVYYPGLFTDDYPDLAARYRVRLQSFAWMPQRCACTGDAAKLAVFIRFANLGARLPNRPAIEEEAAQCRAVMERTCTQRLPIVHDGVLVGLFGR